MKTTGKIKVDGNNVDARISIVLDSLDLVRMFRGDGIGAGKRDGDDKITITVRLDDEVISDFRKKPYVVGKVCDKKFEIDGGER